MMDDGTSCVSVALEDELQSRLDAIMALRNVVVKQREKIRCMRSKERDYKKRLRRQHGGDQEQGLTSPMIVHVDDDNRERVVRFGPTYDKSDDWSSVGDLDFSEQLTQVVESIRQQANHADRVILLNDLEAAQTSISDLRSTIEQKDDEINMLRSQLEARDKQLAETELERDLLKAEAVKCRADLKAYLGAAIQSTPTTRSSISFQSSDVSSPRSAPKPETIAASPPADDSFSPSSRPGRSKPGTRRFFPATSPLRRRSKPPTHEKSIQRQFRPVHLERLLCSRCRPKDQQRKRQTFVALVQEPPTTASTTTTPLSPCIPTEIDCPPQEKDEKEIDRKTLCHEFEMHLLNDVQAQVEGMEKSVQDLQTQWARNEADLVYRLYQIEQTSKRYMAEFHGELQRKDKVIADLQKEQLRLFRGRST